jgi:hypothetical protein
VLDGINKLPPNLLELFLSRHKSTPFGASRAPVRLC